MDNHEVALLSTTALSDLVYVAIICPDLCTTCNGDLGEDQKLVLVKLPVQRGDRVYPYVAITSCSRCAEAKDYAKTKAGLFYWLNEGKLEVLKDV